VLRGMPLKRRYYRRAVTPHAFPWSGYIHLKKPLKTYQMIYKISIITIFQHYIT